MPIVAIVGQWRSGTSLVAQIVNRLGYHAAPTITAPCPPTWRSDWEDLDFTVPLMRRKKIDWDCYLEMRINVSAALGFGGDIAIKSPYLALVWDEFLDAVQPDHIIQTTREDEECERSLKHQPLDVKLYRKDIDKIRKVDKALWVTCFARHMKMLDIPYEDIITHPVGLTSDIAEFINKGTDPETIKAASKLIGKPTEYKTCPQ